MVAFAEVSEELTQTQHPVISIVSLQYEKELQAEVDERNGGSLMSITITHEHSSTEHLDRKQLPRKEAWYSTLLQVAVPFFLAGIGTIGAGLVLDSVQSWPVFTQVSGILVLVPALLGLKGNLDMCLASRLSTQANLGNTTSRREVFQMVVGNIALVQVQAIVAALLVAVFAVTVNFAARKSFSYEHAALLAASSVFTATTCCFTLDFVLIAVVFISHTLTFNPDNLATPLAASIGDVVSVSCLSTVASVLYSHIDTDFWIIYLVIGAYLVLLPIWVWVVIRNKYTSHILTAGWTPVLSALFISGLGGLVLDRAEKYPGFVVFQPIVNGIGGNLVSVQASRISTMLHQTSILGIIPSYTKTWVSPATALFSGVPSARTARILIGMSLPGQLVFLFASDYIKQGQSTVGLVFVLTYLCTTLIQILLLLYSAHVIIHVMWQRKIDPDNSAIPYLTAMGDLSGSTFLFVAFLFLHAIGQDYASNVQ